MVYHSLKIALSFGLTSGVITTLGLMVGLNSGTHSKLVVIGGILTIAVADAFSDALGIHVSEESENVHSAKEVWMSTVFTFISKFIFPLTFILPVIYFELSKAVVINIIWGLSVLFFLSYRMAREQNKPAWKVVAEHVFIAIAVILITHFLGTWISTKCS